MKEWRGTSKQLYWGYIGLGFGVKGLEGIEKKMETIIQGFVGLGRLGFRGLEGMEKKMETTIMGFVGLGFRGLEEMERKMETTTIGYIGTAIRIHSFIHLQQRALMLGSLLQTCLKTY